LTTEVTEATEKHSVRHSSADLGDLGGSIGVALSFSVTSLASVVK
jgi:hypothetical protein